ncbi:hypothetical protein KCP77_07135 [Salmonella enterica subsp. enterica]|nr:hypothetical protein KCP77_07135 [Salmonella enterica subsp. enterica]
MRDTGRTRSSTMSVTTGGESTSGGSNEVWKESGLSPSFSSGSSDDC